MEGVRARESRNWGGGLTCFGVLCEPTELHYFTRLLLVW